MIVVSGWRFAVDAVTNRPVIALRAPVAFDPELDVETVVLGLRVAVASVTYRPDFALR